MQIKNTLTKISGFILGIIFVGGIVFAAAIWNINIPNKAERDIITSIEFNSVVNTLKNVYNDGTNVGINQPAPQETLDVNGDIIASEVLNKDGNYDGPDATLGCSTLGTDNTGNLECHSSYGWVYSGWSSCSNTCGIGTKIRSVTACKRDDGKTVNNSYCNNITKVLKTSCDAGSSTCGWGSFGNWSSCSKSCGGGTKDKTRSCNVSGHCAGSSKKYTSCNTQSCSYNITYKRKRSTYQACSPCLGPEGKCSWYTYISGTNNCGGLNRKLSSFQNTDVKSGSCPSNISSRTPGTAVEILTYTCY